MVEKSLCSSTVYAHPSLNELRDNPTAILRIIDQLEVQKNPC